MYRASREVLGINSRNLDLIYTHNRRKCFPNVDDKLLCKKLLSNNGIPTPQTYGVISGPQSLRLWENHLSNINEFVIKPNRGFGGGGILFVSRSDRGYTAKGQVLEAADIKFHITQILNGVFSLDNIADTAFMEEKLNNHTAIAKLIAPDVSGVADIRIIYQCECPVMAMLRIPTRKSGGTANLHQGGLGIGIDFESGMTTGGCHKNTLVLKHPETGISLVGHTLPQLDEMLNSGAKISQVVKLGYIGVDFVLDRDRGPLVLEVNARPGLNIQIANQAGLRERIQWHCD